MYKLELFPSGPSDLDYIIGRPIFSLRFIDGSYNEAPDMLGSFWSIIIIVALYEKDNFLQQTSWGTRNNKSVKSVSQEWAGSMASVLHHLVYSWLSMCSVLSYILCCYTLHGSMPFQCNAIDVAYIQFVIWLLIVQ